MSLNYVPAVLIGAYQFRDHGFYNSQYFQGCGTHGTPFDYVYTGSGSTSQEALNDALDQIAGSGYAGADLILAAEQGNVDDEVDPNYPEEPTRPHIEDFEHVDQAERMYEEATDEYELAMKDYQSIIDHYDTHYYISIRFSTLDQCEVGYENGFLTATRVQTRVES